MVMLGSVSAVGDVNTGSVVGLCCSVTAVLGSVSAVGTVNTGSVFDIVISLVLSSGISFIFISPPLLFE